LSYDIVRTNYDHIDIKPGQSEKARPEPDGSLYGWQQIEIPSGKIGFVWSRYVRLESETRYDFEKIDGRA